MYTKNANMVRKWAIARIFYSDIYIYPFNLLDPCSKKAPPESLPMTHPSVKVVQNLSLYPLSIPLFSPL